MKDATIKVLFKKKDPTECGNYEAFPSCHTPVKS